MRPLLLLVLALIGAVASASAAPRPYHAPRNAQGQPDLEGTWSFDWITPLQRDDKKFKTLIVPEAAARAFEAHENDPVALAADEKRLHPDEPDVGEDDGFYAWDWKLARIDGQARSSLIVDPADGKVPWTDAGQARRKALRARLLGWDDPDQKTEQERCLSGMGAPAGPPLAPAGPESILQIVQTADTVILVVEANHDARLIRLGRPHAPPQLHPWMGDSIGWWDGDTLVVETTHFNAGEEFRRGFSLSPGARVTERIRRISARELRYSYTVDDPANYKAPWRGELPLAWFGKPLLEDVCHEGDYDTPITFAGVRREEADRKVAIEALAADLRRLRAPAPTPGPRLAPRKAPAARP